MENLILYRKAAGFTKKEMAKELGLSKNEYDLREQGMLPFTDDEMEIIVTRISERLGEFIDPCDIF